MVDSSINLFLVAMRRESFRSLVETRVRDLGLVPPYDELVTRLLAASGDIKKKDFISLVHTYLPADDVKELDRINEVSRELGLQSLEELVSLVALEKISRIVKREGALEERLALIQETLDRSRFAIREPAAKLAENLDTSSHPGLFKFLRYNFYRSKFHLLTAYSGMGKTNFSLILAEQALARGYKTHYISIADWTESELRAKIDKVTGLKGLWVSALDEATIYDVDLELEVTSPDVVIVDSLTDISGRFSSGESWVEYEHKTRHLRRLAVKHKACLVATHQLIVLEDEVIPEDLLGGKAHILKVCDLALGIGGQRGSDTRRVSALKVRHQPTLPPFDITVDFDRLKTWESEE